MLTLTRTARLLLASSLFHVVVWWAVGMPSLEGPVSWRKPIVFGLSTGVLFLSLAWVLALLPTSVRRVRQARLFSVLLLAEVALIDMQQWRGVASHFNTTTAFDGAVFTTMGALIMSAAVIIALWTRDVFREPLMTTPGNAFAARAGMVLLNLGNLIGVVMAATESTELKPMHGVALHAIQAFPVAVWIASRLRYPRAWRHAASGSLSRWSVGWRLR